MTKGLIPEFGEWFIDATVDRSAVSGIVELGSDQVEVFLRSKISGSRGTANCYVKDIHIDGSMKLLGTGRPPFVPRH